MKQMQILKIVTGLLETSTEKSRTLYKQIVKLIWKNGLPGATVFHADEGIDQHGLYQSLYMDGLEFPIIIETIGEEQLIQGIIPAIKNISPHAQIFVRNVYLPLKEEYKMDKEKFYLMKIYVKEEANILKVPNYEKILTVLKDKGLIWSVLIKGVEGFGGDHVIHKHSLFSLSDHTPIIIESVGNGEVLEDLLPQLKSLVKDGIIFVTPVQVELNH